jgi:uncharacterized protein (DUF2249 family)
MQTDVRPARLAAVDADRIVDLDVREDLRNGREPFQRIMQARAELGPGQVLRLRALFEPRPLYRVMEAQGLSYWTEQLAEDDWRVWFYPSAGGEAAGGGLESAPTEASPAVHPSDAPDPDMMRILDVRGLEPPEPMVRTLEAIEVLPPGHTLVQVNGRVPRFLLPELESRGFAYRIDESDPEAVRVLIRRG